MLIAIIGSSVADRAHLGRAVYVLPDQAAADDVRHPGLLFCAVIGGPEPVQGLGEARFQTEVPDAPGRPEDRDQFGGGRQPPVRSGLELQVVQITDVILCLLPAFFIAGAIAVFVSKASVMKYLGASAPKVLAYGVGAVSGTVLAVCSCTVLPLFAGIYTMGAGLGAAMARDSKRP